MPGYINITPECFEKNDQGAQFVALGNTKELMNNKTNSNFSRRIRDKIRRNTRRHMKDIWATLGMADNSEPNWSGTLLFSKSGNNHSVPEKSSQATVDEINRIRKTDGVLDQTLVERFISFEKITFNGIPEYLSNEDAIPLLRLTIMLRETEGALVYYQLYKLGTSGLNEEPDEISLETILPESVESDRMTFLFRIHQNQRIEDYATGLRLGEPIKERFVIKILTFKKNINRLSDHFLNRNHQLLEWNTQQDQFAPIHNKLVDDVPTLLLIHGTISSTNNAFKGLITNGKQSWISKNHASNGGKYKQILAFDHPTFSEDAGDNSKALLEYLGRSFKFTNPIHVIGHSRGCLLAKYISLNNQNRIPISKGVLVAGANGVGYFKGARNLSYMLSIFKYLNVGNPIVLSIIQRPLDSFIKTPGAVLMTPKSDKLLDILRDPADNTTKFLPIAGSYQNSQRNGSLIRRWSERGIDKVIGLFLGKRHDWVVGTDQQLIISTKQKIPEWDNLLMDKNYILPMRHSDYLRNESVHDRLNDFLLSN